MILVSDGVTSCGKGKACLGVEGVERAALGRSAERRLTPSGRSIPPSSPPRGESSRTTQLSSASRSSRRARSRVGTRVPTGATTGSGARPYRPANDQRRGSARCAPTSSRAARSPITSCPITTTAAVAQRDPGQRPDDPHARAGPLLPEGAPAAPRARRALPEDQRGLHPDRHDLHRRAPHGPRRSATRWARQRPFLSDPGRIVQKDLDIQEYTDPDNDPMIPHTLVLKPGLVVHRVYNGYWFWGRPSSTTSGTTCARSTARPSRTGISDAPACARRGTRATCRAFHGWSWRAAPSRNAT